MTVTARRQGRSCRVCHLPPSEAELVEGASSSGWSPRSIAARFGTLNRRDIAGHMARCVANEEKEE